MPRQKRVFGSIAVALNNKTIIVWQPLVDCKTCFKSKVTRMNMVQERGNFLRFPFTRNLSLSIISGERGDIIVI